MASDPTSALMDAVRVYLAAVDPRFPIEWVKLSGSDGSKIRLRFRIDLRRADPPVTPGPGVQAGQSPDLNAADLGTVANPTRPTRRA